MRLMCVKMIALIAVVLSATTVSAQETPEADAPVRFTLNGAPYDQVLDILARQTGMPVIRQTPVPDATMTFISPESYSIAEAVEIVNLTFKTHGVRVEQEESFLFLRSIADAAKRPMPVVDLSDLDALPPDEYVTLSIPLENAMAAVLAERLAPLVAAPGMVQSVDAQNLLVIVETGEQCRRLARLVERVDSQRPADVDYGLFPLRFAQANKLVETIRQLIPERDQLVVMDNNKQPKVYDDVSKPPLRLSIAEELNAIVAVGPPTRIQVVSDLIEELDVPAGGSGGRMVRSYRVERLDANEAGRHLAPLFSDLPQARRPVIRALPSVSRVVIAADEEQLAQLEAVLEDLDPGITDRANTPDAGVRVVTLEHLDPREAQSMIDRLLPRHHRSAARTSPTPDGGGLAVSGPRDAIDAVADLLGTLDVEPSVRATARVVAIDRGDPQAIVDEALRVDALTDEGQRDPVRAMVDADDRAVTLIGSSGGVGRVQRLISEQMSQIARKYITRVIDVRAMDAADLVEPLLALLAEAPELEGRDAPTIRVIEPSNSLVVTADSETHRVVSELASRLDRVEDRPEIVTRVFNLSQSDASTVARELDRTLNDQNRWPETLRRAQASGQPFGRPTARADARANRVIVEAPAALLDLAASVVESLDGATLRPVEVRAFRLQEGDAESVAQALNTALSADVAPGDPRPSVTPETGSNSVIVTGSADAMRRAEELVAAMDERAEVEGIGVRTVVLEHARAEAVAPTVERLLAQDNLTDLVPVWLRWQMVWELERRGRPVDVRTARVAADARTNAVLITAPLELLDMGEQITRSLDVPGDASGVETRRIDVIALANADAGQVEPAVRAMFEEDAESAIAPPAVRADRSSNALIVRGTAEQLAAVRDLVRQLDAAAATATGNVRTVPVDPSRMNADEAARRVRALLERRGGVRVEVITADELTGENPDTGEEGESETETPGGLSDAGWGTPGAWMIGPIVGLQPAAERFSEPEEERRQDEPVVRITVDPATNSLVVEGSSRVSDQIQQIVRDLERQTPPEATAVRIVELPAGVDPNAIASYVSQTVNMLGRTSVNNPGGFTGRVGVRPDRATGSLIVWANDTDFVSVRELIAGLARAERPIELTVKIYQLDNVNANRARGTVQGMLNPNRGTGRRSGEVNITLPGEDGEPDRTASIDPSVVTVTTDPSYTALVITAPDDAFDVIDALVESIDKSPAGERLAIRRYELEHAESRTLARTLQSLFDASRQGPVAWESPRARFVSDDRSNALLVTATRAQHAEVAQILVEADQSEDLPDAQLEIIGIRDGRPSAIARVIQEVLVGRDPGKRESMRISAQDDARVLVVRAPAEDIEEIKSLVSQLDQEQGASYPVRSIKLESADAESVANSLRGFFRDRARINRQRGIRTGGGDAAIIGDRRSGTIIVAASEEDYEQISSLIAQFDTPAEGREFDYRILTLEHIQVSDIEDTVQNITWELQWERSPWFRGNRGGGSDDRVYVQTNERTNTVLLFGNGDTFDIIERIIADLDRPGENSGGVIVRAVSAPGTDLNAIARIVENTSGTPNWYPWRGRDPNKIEVEVDRRRQVLLLVGKKQLVDDAVAQVKAIVDGGIGEGEIVEVIALQSARAADLSRALTQALPETVRVKVTPVSRTNSVMLTGTQEDLEIVRGKIAELDTAPEQPPVEFQRFALDHADARELSIVLRELVRNRPRGQGEPRPGIDYLLDSNTIAVTATSDEMAFIAQMVGQFDVERESERTTEFVRLEYADAEQTAEALKVFYGRFAPEATTSAERAVSIVPDPASNSLVISADGSTWEGIRELLVTLDTEEYDTSQQLVVMPLKHASAVSVARALNEGFRQPLEDQLDRERVRLEAERRARGNRDRDFVEPAVLVESEGVPVVSAETQTNSLLVFAGRKELNRIRQIVEQLDVPDFLELPETRVVPIRHGRATVIANAARRVFVTDAGGANPRRVLIEGDDFSDTVLVRAEAEEFREIRSFIAEMEEQAEMTQPRARVVRVRSLPAARVRDAVQRTLGPIAQQRGEILSVQIERTTNALIVSASRDMFEQVRGLVEELDGGPADAEPGQPAPPNDSAAGFGAGMTVVAVKNTTPQEMIRTLQQMGVTRAAPADRPGLVIDPVSLVALPERSAIGVVGTAADVGVIQRLVAVLDDASVASEQHVGVVRMRTADAGQVVQRVRAMLDGDTSVTDAGPARALAEHVRRLRLERDGRPVELDLAVPVRLIADPGSNSVLIASSVENVAAVAEVVRLLDRLPAGESVLVRIFPLENAAADRVERVLEELFREGDRVRRASGTNRETMPTSTVGQALAGEISVTTEERTNSVIVAGPEPALALVEVLIADLDGEDADRGWLDVVLVPLEHADAVTLADRLREVLIEGVGDTPEAVGLRRQIGRLRVGGAGDAVETDVFAPMAGVVITPEESLNALVVVATPTNVRAIRELVAMLDVEGAGSANSVRVVPLVHADARRVADIVDDTFDERARLPSAREEDRVTVNVDERTNALVVSTSPRSFEILQELIATLDQPEARFAVGLHVIEVPGADVRALAPRIERLMRDRLDAARARGGRESPMDVFSIEADQAAGVLIVACSDENLALVNELIGALTSGVAAEAEEGTTLIQLQAPGRAVEVSRAVDELYVQPQLERRGARAVAVVPSERLNALLVTGTPEDVVAIREIAERLDGASPGLVEDVRRIPLDSANARDTVALIEDVLAGRSISGSGAGQRATRVRVLSDRLEEARAEAMLDGDIRDQVTLTPDPRTNSVLVKAPPELMDLIVAMVEDLDGETRGDRVIEAFRLANADAAQMQELLVDLFNLERRGDRYVLTPYGEVPVEEGEAQSNREVPFAARAVTPISDERRELAVTVDRRTNTLLASGTPELMEEVSRVVAALDSIEANQREREVYHLKNAQAAELATTLQDYFAGESDLRRSTLGPQLSGSLLRELDQEVTVIGDPSSNKLIISASPRYIDTVRAIVEELDASPPQVMIEVLIAEVTLNASEEYGVDIAIGGVVATTTENGLNSQVSGSSIGGDGFVFDALSAGTGVATALGVPNLAVASSDFGLIIRALQSQGKLEVLSRPQVQVNDNEAAFINVGENIAITDGVERRDNVTTAIVRRENVGITLDVTPSISSDGYVRLDITPEISILSDRTTQIDENFQAPIITQRRVETTVTVKDGETVVIGGLIQTSDSVTKTKTPFLGDLPVVGGLFRSTDQAQIKTELLVILTPHVIPGQRNGASSQLQRELTERSLNSLQDRSSVDELLRLGDDPETNEDRWIPLYDQEWADE
ncbi:MAG: secretin N-terminal domain-containing protein [Phycisphaerales bacterium]